VNDIFKPMPMQNVIIIIKHLEYAIVFEQRENFITRHGLVIGVRFNTKGLERKAAHGYIIVPLGWQVKLGF